MFCSFVHRSLSRGRVMSTSLLQLPMSCLENCFSFIVADSPKHWVRILQIHPHLQVCNTSLIRVAWRKTMFIYPSELQTHPEWRTSVAQVVAALYGYSDFKVKLRLIEEYAKLCPLQPLRTLHIPSRETSSAMFVSLSKLPKLRKITWDFPFMFDPAEMLTRIRTQVPKHQRFAALKELHIEGAETRGLSDLLQIFNGAELTSLSFFESELDGSNSCSSSPPNQPPWLLQTPKLRRLGISLCSLTFEGAQEIFAHAPATIVDLDVSQSSYHSVEYLTPECMHILSTRCPNVKYLHMHEWGTCAPEDLARFTKLQKLLISGTHDGDCNISGEAHLEVLRPYCKALKNVYKHYMDEDLVGA